MTDFYQHDLLKFYLAIAKHCRRWPWGKNVRDADQLCEMVLLSNFFVILKV